VSDDLRVPMESRDDGDVVDPPQGWRRGWAHAQLLLSGGSGRIVATVLLSLLAAVAVWGVVHGHGGGLGLLVAAFWLYKLWRRPGE
jgi:hypothetical protein